MSTKRMHTSAAAAALIALTSAMAFPSHGQAGTKALVRLDGPVIVTDVSGKKGTAYNIGRADSDSYALWGLLSKETKAFSNVPCWLSIQTEDVNDSADDPAWHREFCDGKKTGDVIEAHYSDTSWAGSRVFVSGVSVCLNGDETRVKGLRLRGRTIADDGTLVDLEQWQSTVRPASGGETRLTGITEPSDKRPNCRDWSAWAECPYSMLATGVVAHFESGAEPRGLKGIALQCRAVSISGLSATRS